MTRAFFRRCLFIAAATTGAACGLLYLFLLFAFAFVAVALVMLRVLFEMPALIWDQAMRAGKE